MKFEFGSPRRVLFGAGEFYRLGELTAGFGRRALLMKGCSSLNAVGHLDDAKESLRVARVEFEVLSMDHEPTVAGTDDLALRARAFAPEVIVAIGGGSTLDAGKAVAALLTNGNQSPVSVREFLEGGADARPIRNLPVPVIAIPTTAGTGSEVTKNAVIRSDDYSFKRSMRSPLMRPEVALVDPDLSASMPPNITAATGADAETQLIEAYTSRRASLMTDGFAREGLKLTGWALEHAFLNPDDDEAREAMAMAGLLSGMALDNAGLGAVHGLASPIGALFDIPHGVICGNLLPEITEANLARARELQGADSAAAETMSRYREVASLLEGSDCDVEGLVEFLQFQRRILAIPGLATFGVHDEDIPQILEGCRAGSMKTNPVDLSDEVLSDVLRRVIRNG